MQRRGGRFPLVVWLVTAVAVVGVLAVVAGLLLVTGVVGDGGDDDEPATAGSWPSTRPSLAGNREVTLGGEPADLGTTLDATAASLDQFWSEELPKVYDRAFTPLAGGLQPKTPDSAPWTCGDQRLTYEDVQGNAFYCGTGGDDYVAYDAASLLPQLDQVFGALTPAVVLAHEVGHAVQARAEVQAPSVLTELQADCFAGAWVAYARDSDSDQVVVTQAGLDASVRALPALRDQPGTAATRQGAHGLAFDRVNAFQTGYERGAERCASVAQGDVTVTELPFRTVAEAESGGDLSYAETVPFAVQRLDAFWATTLPQLAAGTVWRAPEPSPQGGSPLPACPDDQGYDAAAVAAYCSADNTVAWSDATLSQLQATTGDLASSATLAEAWARAGQVQAGTDPTGETAALQQVCFTGAWVASLAAASGPGSVSLSPGDIDEALAAVLVPLTGSAADSGGSFARANAYRSGVLSGSTAC